MGQVARSIAAGKVTPYDGIAAVRARAGGLWSRDTAAAL
jgi:hypothetical protein